MSEHESIIGSAILTPGLVSPVVPHLSAMLTLPAILVPSQNRDFIPLLRQEGVKFEWDVSAHVPLGAVLSMG